jgi:hypothetical protein
MIAQRTLRLVRPVPQAMSDPFELQIGTYEHRLDHLLRDGRDLYRHLRAIDRDLGQDLQAMRAWQRECAATISQLSGGSKQHWLSRAYSEAFLPGTPGAPGTSGRAVEEISVDAIVERIMGVLREAQASLAGLREHGPSGLSPTPAPRRFPFVLDADLRPRLEQAFVDAQAAFDRGAHSLALITWASILEAILTDALTHADAGSRSGAHDEPIAAWSFEARIAAAEQAGLISAGCARLPSLARGYRACLDEHGELRPDIPATEVDARRTGQVLRLIMRDLQPGR